MEDLANAEDPDTVVADSKHKAVEIPFPGFPQLFSNLESTIDTHESPLSPIHYVANAAVPDMGPNNIQKVCQPNSDTFTVSIFAL